MTDKACDNCQQVYLREGQACRCGFIRPVPAARIPPSNLQAGVDARLILAQGKSPSAYSEGRNAAKLGRKHSDNPYSHSMAHVHEWQDWNRGVSDFHSGINEEEKIHLGHAILRKILPHESMRRGWLINAIHLMNMNDNNPMCLVSHFRALELATDRPLSTEELNSIREFIESI